MHTVSRDDYYSIIFSNDYYHLKLKSFQQAKRERRAKTEQLTVREEVFLFWKISRLKSIN